MFAAKELSRAFLNWRFAIAVAASLGLQFWALVNTYSLDPTPPSAEYPFFFNAYDAWCRGIVGFALFAPLVATLPYADSLLQYHLQGFARYTLLRMPHGRYLKTKFLVNALVGGLVVALPMVLFFVFTMLHYPRGLPPVPPVSDANGPVWQMGFLSEYYKPHPDLYIAARILLGFCFGGTFAPLGMALSPFVRIRYVILAFPFVFFIAFGYAANIVGMPVWWPEYALTPDGILDSSALTVFAPLGLLFLGSTLCIFGSIRKDNDAWLY